MDTEITPPASRGRLVLGLGIALVIAGLAGFVLFVTLVAPGGGEPEAWRSLVWIGAALATGLGAALVVSGIVRRLRLRADARGRPRP